MFYKQMLLSKNGALGTIWIAAHCYRNLRKDQVKQTNISSSVDKILEDDVSSHRILAYLLLGVVRIYSKKMEYLFHDCNDVIDKLCQFKIDNSKRVSVGFGGESSGTHRVVKRPKRFELDAFDFQVLGDRYFEGRNVSPPEKLLLKEGLGEEGNMSQFLYKDKMLYREESATFHTPIRDVILPHSMEREMYVGPSHNMHDTASNSDIFCKTIFTLEDRLEPMVLDEAEEELMNEKSPIVGLNDHDNDDYGSDWENGTDSVPDMEKDQGIEISLADHVNITVLNETQEQQMIDELMTPIRTEGEQHESTKSVNETPESKKRRRKDKRAVSITVDVTPASNIAEHSVGAQDSIAIPTPAAQESWNILKRRKTLCDNALVGSNKAFNGWTKNAKNLMRKKPKGPHTRLQAWGTQKLCRLPDSILEPLIPGTSMNLCSIECEKNATGSETFGNQDDVSSPVAHEDREEISNVRDLETRKFPEDASVSPGTPVTPVHLNLSRLLDETKVVPANSHHDGTTSLPFNEEMHLDDVLCTEEEISSGDSRQSDPYSDKTRMAEDYLRNSFDSKKRNNEDEVLNLSQLLSRQTKKESARLFYETLVLKTLDRIDVQQECAYGDICLSKTSKFQA